MRVIARPVPAGTRPAVSSDTTIITANPSGTVTIAGCSISVPAQPESGPGAPTMRTTPATAAGAAPATIPAAAPAGVSRHHHTPSTRSGDSDEAATAKAIVTSAAASGVRSHV